MQQTTEKTNQNQQNGQTQKLVWMDMEMSGLEPERDVVLEIATIITDKDLNIIASGPELIIHQDESLFAKMDQWNQEHHQKSGLWQAVLNSKVTLEEAESQTYEFLKKHINPKQSPLCGNSIWQDRRFLIKYMPLIDQHLHYRLIDVSTVKELASRWFPDTYKFHKKSSAHRAMEDIIESIEELRHYRKILFKDK